MKAIGIIPARWGSTRFPGKPLALIAGRPLLQWVVEGSNKSSLLKQICVATDDVRIARPVEAWGARAIMTDSNLPTGTDRIWQALRALGDFEDQDVVVNIQGDEPLISGDVLDRLVGPMLKNPTLEMATLGRTLRREELDNRNVAKIVCNARGEALYFSRFPIPFSRSLPDLADDQSEIPTNGVYKHVGVYAYRAGFLQRFCEQAPTQVELAESLEQLRALYLGARVKVIAVEHDSLGVDVPDDIAKVEEKLRASEEKRK